MNSTGRLGWRAALVSVLCAMMVVGGASADPPEQYAFVAYDDGLREAKRKERKVFLYFGRYGCGWCDLTNKQAFSDAGVREAYQSHYVLVYVDAESGRRLMLPSGERITEMELGARFNAFATPLFAFLEPDGKLIFKVAGLQSAKDLLNYDRFVHGGIYQSKDIKQFLSESR